MRSALVLDWILIIIAGYSYNLKVGLYVQELIWKKTALTVSLKFVTSLNCHCRDRNESIIILPGYEHITCNDTTIHLHPHNVINWLVLQVESGDLSAVYNTKLRTWFPVVEWWNKFCIKMWSCLVLSADIRHR